MSAEGVPPEVGMKLTGHKSQGAYSRYNRAIEAQVRATQRTAGDGTAYAANVAEETEFFKMKIVAGSEAEDPDETSPTKRTKLQVEGQKIMSVSAESVLQQTSQGSPHAVPELTMADVPDWMSVSNVPQADKVQHEHKDLPATPCLHLGAKEPKPLAVITGDDDWLEAVNWDDYMQEFDKTRLTITIPSRRSLEALGRSIIARCISTLVEILCDQ